MQLLTLVFYRMRDLKPLLAEGFSNSLMLYWNLDLHLFICSLSTWYWCPV